MLRSDLCDYSYEYIVVKDRTTAEGNNNEKTRNKSSKIMLHLDHAYKKSMARL